MYAAGTRTLGEGGAWFSPRADSASLFGFGLQQGFENRPLGVGKVRENVLALSPPIDNTKFDLL